MIQEMMGLGLMKYCIVYNEMPNSFQRLLLLINYLPQKKMCFYPPQVILEPPFDHSPWREIGEAICSRGFHLNNHLFRVILRISSPWDSSQDLCSSTQLYCSSFTKKEDRVEEYLWQSYKSFLRRMDDYESSYLCKFKKQRECFEQFETSHAQRDSWARTSILLYH